MKNKKHKQHYYRLLLAGLISLSLQATYAQTEEEDETDGEVFELSPFEVDTTSDRGYYAANTISGSRINIALQDMPMPIEVITSEFIEDTGSTDLRESLRYSSGILLTTQSPNDGLEGVPGGVHNGEGASANITDTTIKVRGFITDSSLRKGFRRQHGSDSVNIDRIEVVRGPAALLYGIGNFGGIVNYLPKRPLTFQQTTTALTLGSDSFKRATLDTTAPVNDQLSYRVTAAAEDGNHWTDYQNHQKLFVSPVVVYKPFEKTKITVDYEVGTDTTNGVGFQRMRARATGLNPDQVITQQGRLQKGGFVVFDGIDNRTARLSGPDTYVQTDASNILLELEQNLFEGLDLMIGYNRADSDVEILDITANAYNSGLGPTGLRRTIYIEPFVDQSGNPVYDNEIGEAEREVTDAILMYQWKEETVGRMREELKAELTYSFDLLKNSRWFNMSHTFLAGYSDLTQERGTELWLSGGGGTDDFLYRDPYNFEPIRFGEGVIDNGSPNGTPGFPALLQTKRELSIAGDEATYIVWQGRFLNDRITAIAGQRRDENSQNITLDTYTDGELSDTTVTNPAPQKETTNQYGLTVEVLNGVSVFALRAEGLEPNFDGWRDGLGNPINGKKAESEELGVKLNLFGGKVAATISTYKINVVGPTSIAGGGLWWAPAPAKGRYNPNEPTVYQLSEIEKIGGTWVAWGGVGNNPAFEANRAAWEAAAAAGDVFIGADGQTYLTVLDANGNDTPGAAFMDGMYSWTAAGNGWPMWMFHASPNPETLANNAAMDWAAGDVDYFAYMVGEEESKGYEFQVLFTPTDNWQIYMSYAHTEREIIDQGKFPQYPYPQDRWAIWYFPDGNWGLQGASKEQAYEDPQDTSTWTGGPASTNGESLDDTPEHDFSIWSSYTFKDGAVDGLKVGLGAYYQSEREYLSGFTVGGDAITGADGQRIKLYTDTKLQFGGMLRYDFDWGENPAWVQLNIDNILDDEDLYGYVYEAGRSFRLQAGVTF